MKNRIHFQTYSFFRDRKVNQLVRKAEKGLEEKKKRDYIDPELSEKARLETNSLNHKSFHFEKNNIEGIQMLLNATLKQLRGTLKTQFHTQTERLLITN